MTAAVTRWLLAAACTVAGVAAVGPVLVIAWRLALWLGAWHFFRL
jgi:hypothetical protein